MFASHQKSGVIMNEDPYKVLGIDRRASTAEVKKAYFNLVKRYSPETHAERFKEVRRAYDRLKTRERRQETDVFLYNDPYGDFKPVAEECRFKAKVDVGKVVEAIMRASSDLDRVDFSEDFTPIDLD